MSALITPWKNGGKQGPVCVSVCVRERERGGQIINPHKVQQKMIVDPISPGLCFSPLSALAHRSRCRSSETLQGHLLLYSISGPSHLSNTFNTSWAFLPLWKNCSQTFLMAQQHSCSRINMAFKFISNSVHLFSLLSVFISLSQRSGNINAELTGESDMSHFATWRPFIFN